MASEWGLATAAVMAASSLLVAAFPQRDHPGSTHSGVHPHRRNDGDTGRSRDERLDARALQGAWPVHPADRLELPAARTSGSLRRQGADRPRVSSTACAWGLVFTIALTAIGAVREIASVRVRCFADASLLFGPFFKFMELRLLPAEHGCVDDDSAARRFSGDRSPGRRQAPAGSACRQGDPDGRRARASPEP
jgi:hypothetical protein